MYQNYIIIEDSAAGRIRYLKKTDPDYPAILRLYPRMPAGIYLIGSLPDPARKSVAIVGSRGCSPYGRKQAALFGRVLASYGVQIISGMAEGVDSCAQMGAMDSGGKTFAVLGCGPDICYPRSSRALYQRLVTDGGILSEFEPSSPPMAWHFPIRNRIISALSDIVLVIEAREKSGSLITADYALEQGKTIFAVPGRNDDILSQGTNRLIAQGASLAGSPDAILEELGIKSGRKIFPAREADSCRPVPEILSGNETFRKIYGSLDSSPKSMDRILSESGICLASAGNILMQLCLSGLAEETAPGFYIRSG